MYRVARGWKERTHPLESGDASAREKKGPGFRMEARSGPRKRQRGLKKPSAGLGANWLPQQTKMVFTGAMRAYLAREKEQECTEKVRPLASSSREYSWAKGYSVPTAQC
jgi:hypothetical protein